MAIVKTNLSLQYLFWASAFFSFVATAIISVIFLIYVSLFDKFNSANSTEIIVTALLSMYFGYLTARLDKRIQTILKTTIKEAMRDKEQ
jgi:uncharacterized membrane protein YqjE